MAEIVRFSEATAIAIHASCLLADGDGNATRSAPSLARRLGVSLHHLVKVLQRLVRGGVLRSVRGVRGGFRLARAPGLITLQDVLEAIEGPLSCRPCLLPRRACGGRCVFGSALEDARRLLRSRLSRTRLDVAAARFASPSPGEAP